MAKTVFDDTPPLGTIVTADFLNAVNNHRHTGRNIDGDGALDYAEASGSDNDYVLTLSPVLDAHIAGMGIRFKANHTNTGAATVNINGLGAITLKKSGDLDVAAGDIKSGTIYEIAYDGTNYQIISSTPSQLYYIASTGSDNAYVLTLSPALTAHVNGQPIRFKANHTNTGAATVNINGLGAIALKKKVSVALAAGDIVSGQIVEIAYDGTNYQIMVSGQAVDLSQHVASIGTNGYEISPRGVIRQWGKYVGALEDNQQITITLPLEFPNGMLGGHGTIINSAGKDSANIWMQVKSWTTTQVVFISQGDVQNGGDGFFWEVVGY